MMNNNNSLGPFLVNRFGDHYLYDVNNSTFNQAGSYEFYKWHYSSRLHKKDKLYLIVGCDSGLLLRYLVAEPIPQGSRYLVVELPSVLDFLQGEGLVSNLPEQVVVVTPDKAWEKADELQFSDYVYLGAVDFVEAVCAIDAHLPEYRDVVNSIQEQLRQFTWRITAELGQVHFIEKQLENLAENRYEAACLEGICPGKTAVILAGGPSLDAIIPWVKENIDRVAVFAVSRISRQLLDNNLAPHVVFSVDPQDVSFDVSREMLQFGDDVLFVNAYHTTPLLLGQWPGRSVYLGPRFPWDTPLNLPNFIASGPTVTNAALSVAVAMGFSQIIFGGVDLCYSGTGITHASGSAESVAGPRLGHTVSVETNRGHYAETGPDYAAAIATMGEQAKFALGKGCRIVNPMPDSAKIPFVEHLSLEEIPIDHLNQPFGLLLRRLLPVDSSVQRVRYYHTVLNELQRVRTDLRKIGRLAEEALDSNAKLFGRNGRKGDFRYKIRMDKIEKRLNRNFGNLGHLLKRYGIRSFFKIVRPGGKDSWSDEEVENAGQVYYQAYRDSASKVLGLVISAHERVASRLEEEQGAPNCPAFLSLWRKDRQPGRGRLWIARHPNAYAALPPEVQSDFVALERELSEQLIASGQTLTGAFKKSRTLTGVISRAHHFFKASDKEGLLRLLVGLAAHPDREAAQLLEHVIEGYVAELDDCSDEALAHYEALVGDSFEPLTEVALKRILFIALSKHDRELSLSALECLAHAALVYKPQYADLLRILGRLQDAADVYVDYLEKVPGDIAVLLKLGQLYRSMGQESAAAQIFGMVLEMDPSNRAAQALLQ